MSYIASSNVSSGGMLPNISRNSSAVSNTLLIIQFTPLLRYTVNRSVLVLKIPLLFFAKIMQLLKVCDLANFDLQVELQ